jgi:hypothetical protein
VKGVKLCRNHWQLDENNAELSFHDNASADAGEFVPGSPGRDLYQTECLTGVYSGKRGWGFDLDPNVSVVLLIDFENDGHAIWPVLLEQLQPFRDRNWLTYYDGEDMYHGPLTIVGTGSTPLKLVQSSLTNRFVFFDVPLTSVSDDNYNSTNSYYASASLKDTIGKLWFNRLSSK